MAKALAFVQDNGIQSLEELEQLDAAVSDDFTKINKTLKDTESRLRKVNLMIKNTGQYLANKDVYRRYLAAKNKAVFREAHRAELSLYEAARKYLQEESGGDKLPTMKMLKEEKAKLTAQKNQQYEEYSIAKARHRELQAVTHNVHIAMGISDEQAKERTANRHQKQKEQSVQVFRTGTDHNLVRGYIQASEILQMGSDGLPQLSDPFRGGICHQLLLARRENLPGQPGPDGKWKAVRLCLVGRKISVQIFAADA